MREKTTGGRKGETSNYLRSARRVRREERWERGREEGWREGGKSSGREGEGGRVRSVGEGRDSAAQARQGRVGTKWWQAAAGVKECCYD